MPSRRAPWPRRSVRCLPPSPTPRRAAYPPQRAGCPLHGDEASALPMAGSRSKRRAWARARMTAPRRRTPSTIRRADSWAQVLWQQVLANTGRQPVLRQRGREGGQEASGGRKARRWCTMLCLNGGRVHEVVRWRGSGGWEGHAPRSWCRSCRLARNEALGLLPSGPAWKLPSLVAKLPAGVQYGVVPALVVAGDDLPDGWPDEGRNTRFLACGHRRRDGFGGCGRGRRSAGCGRGVGEWFVRSCGGGAPCTAARAARRTGSAAA